MNIKTVITYILVSVSVYLLMGTSCTNYTNFTTYFNTYYNMERLQYEAEEEFEFQDEKKRVQPRVFVPQPEFYVKDESQVGPPAFLQEFIVTKQKRQPVQVKLDSIIIKGSKILAFKGKSDYVEGALWLMAKSFFYQEDWLNSQLKCSELVDKFPDGDLSPDAHLLYTKDLLIQRKMGAGKTMLSRTIDIAWQKKRYDILSEAFRIEAELALLDDNFDLALRPYQNAIGQTDDGEIKARWQLDMAALMFRMAKFDKAEEAFRKVHAYSPDYLQKFEAYLYQAASLARLGRYYEADEIFKRLNNDGKYEEWKAYTYVQELQATRIKWLDSNYVPYENEPIPNLDRLAEMEKTADSAYANNPSLLTYYFEKGMNFYDKNDYSKARSLFAKARVTRTPVFKSAEKMFELMNNWDIKRRFVEPLLAKFDNPNEEVADSTKLLLASNLYALGRIHEELGNQDSVVYYYSLAVKAAPVDKPESAKYYHGLARVTKSTNPMLADSLLDIIVSEHPLTEFGKDAQLQLGYTNNYVIDTVAELYTSGLNLMRSGDYNFSINQFKKLYLNYPKSKYAPAALYTIGWNFEKNLKMQDSALYYYNILLTEYPETDYAKDISLGVTYKLAVNSGETIPDSLKTKNIIVPPPPELDKKKLVTPRTDTQIISNQKPNAMDILKDPTKFLNNPKGLMQNPLDVLKDVDLPTNPLTDPVKFFKLDEEPPSDSTNTNSGTTIPPTEKK